MAKEHLELPGGKRADRKVKILRLQKGDSVSLQYMSEGNSASTHTLHKGDSLSIVDADFDGVSIAEISKLQEVGRGLRLPVDSAENRISDDSFMLNC